MAEWVEVLRRECERSSQRQVAARLGYRSNGVVSQLLRGTFRGSRRDAESRVKRELMCVTVSCPVLGEISVERCRNEKCRPFAATNEQRVALWRACRNGCAHAGGRE